MMGLSESTMHNCIADALGSFDCTCKSKGCDYFECMKLYYRCRTTNGDIISDSEHDEFTPSVSETALTNN